MPPKKPPPRKPPPKEAASEPTPTPAAAPASPEDVKPNVAALEQQDAEQELPSDPLAAPRAQASPTTTTPLATPAPSARSTPSGQQIATPNRSTPAASTTRGKKPVAPRNVARRSQAQREELQRQEDERKRQEQGQRAREEAAKRRYNGRGRGRGGFRGRGRGGYMGESDRGPAASGPLSAGEIANGKRSSGNWRTSGGISRGSQRGLVSGRPAGDDAQADTEESGTFLTGKAPPKKSTPRSTTGSGGGGGGGGSRTADDGTRVKTDPDRKPNVDVDGDIAMGRGIVPTDGGYISSDHENEEKEHAQRFNIEDLIDLTREDGEEDPMAPVRMKRIAHKERVLDINADGATGKDGVIDVGANDAAPSAKKKGKQRARDVLQEISSGDDGEPAVVDVKPDPTTVPNESREPPEPMDIARINVDDIPLEPPSGPESKRKAKEKIKSRALSDPSLPGRPALQTQEEVEEWDRNQADLRLLRGELGTPAPIAAVDGETTAQDRRADKVYLFQFPPVLPDLTPLAIKPDPDAPQPDTMQVDPKRPFSSKENPITISDSKTSTPSFPSGKVGKLNIHKSGKATLDWGGTSFCMGMGTEASFLQDIFVAKMAEGEGGGDTAMGGVGAADRGGVALSMGQVKGKFVVTPDWDEILG